jgi:hypothetical protein
LRLRLGIPPAGIVAEAAVKTAIAKSAVSAVSESTAVAGSIRLAEGTVVCARTSGLPVLARLSQLISKALQIWLVRRGDESAAVGGRIVYKLPLVVFVLVVVLVKCVVFAGAGYAHDWASAKYLPSGALPAAGSDLGRCLRRVRSGTGFRGRG